MKTTKIILALLVILSLVCTFGCTRAGGTWEGICGSYVWDESSQFTNSTLNLMWLGNDCVLFEFRLMAGSETVDSAVDLTVSGVMSIGDDGVGTYEVLDENGEVTLALSFTLSGDTVSVSHEGELPISPNGNYTFSDEYIEISEYSAVEIVKHLPTNATSLNSNVGAYTIAYPDGLLSDWFYYVEATLDDTGAVLASFVVAKDLSAVFRVDADIEPTLIYGSAASMMEAESWMVDDGFEFEYGDIEGASDTAAGELSMPDEEEIIEATPIISVGVDGGSVVALGATATFEVYMPWELPYTIDAGSADSGIVEVSGDTLKAVGVGETEITGKVVIADGEKEFTVVVTVVEDVGLGDLIGEEFAGEVEAV